MHHVAVALDRHQLVDLLGPKGDDPADVVAGQVDQHDVLGQLLGRRRSVTARMSRATSLELRLEVGTDGRGEPTVTPEWRPATSGLVRTTCGQA